MRLLGTMLASSVLVCAATGTAAAQPGRFYVGGAIGSFKVSADEVSGTSAAGSVLAGVMVVPWLDIEVDVALPTSPFTRSYGGDVLSSSFPPSGATASREEIEQYGVWLRYDHRREVTASISTVAIFHSTRGRIRPGFVVGVTNQRLRHRTDYTPVKIGPALDPNHRSASPQTQESSRTEGALTMGLNVAIAVNRHLWVVPDLRYDYGSIGDEINNALRSSVRVLWRF